MVKWKVLDSSECACDTDKPESHSIKNWYLHTVVIQSYINKK
jgi:hypothetical protein